MRVVIQRVLSAEVVIDGAKSAGIGKGLLAFVGFAPEDGMDQIEYVLDRLIKMRVFEDENGKMNLSVADTEAGLLIVPNFTLYGDLRSRRPGFSYGAPPDKARGLFELMKRRARELFPSAQFGVFQADMKIHIVNDGPVTFVLEN